MSGRINYSIVSGQQPFVVEIVPSTIPPVIHNVIGDYSIDVMDDGTYNLIITDSNDCQYNQEVIINPYITTTTTTISEDDYIVVGNTNDENLIFNTNSTNRNTRYVGYPNNNIVTLYLWFKTYGNKPLTQDKIITYNIYSNSGSTFIFNELSDQINSGVIQNIVGPSESITGNLILRSGFIETFFKYTYNKNEITPEFNVDLSINDNKLYRLLELTGSTKQYGITYIDNATINLKF
jgi:hypothetical protein